MTVKLIIKKVLAIVLLLSLVMCSKSKSGENANDSEMEFSNYLAETTKKDPMLIPVGKDIADAMYKSYANNSSKILNQNGLIKDSVFVLSKNNWKWIRKFVNNSSPKNVHDIKFYFVQFNSKDFPTLPKEYDFLKQYDGKLYILAGFFDKDKNIIGNNYYAILSSPNTNALPAPIQINSSDFKTMQTAYINNIKIKYLDQLCKSPMGNTLSVNVEEIRAKTLSAILDAYDGLSSKKKFNQFNFRLAEVIDLGVTFSGKQFSSEFKVHTPEQTGQLTFITAAMSSDETTTSDASATGKVESLAAKEPISGLGDLDMNYICPTTCP